MSAIAFDSVIFDLDGTLVDSAPGVVAGLRLAMEAAGKPLPAEPDLGFWLGPPFRITYAEWLGVPQGDPAVAEALKVYRAYYSAGGLMQCETYPGVPELVRELYGAGVPLAVGTSKREDFAGRVVEGIGLRECFGLVRGSGTHLPHERDEKVEVFHSVRETGAAPGRTVVVGDRRFDGDAARELGLPFIGVSWGYGSEPELAACEPIAIVGDAAGLWAALQAGV